MNRESFKKFEKEINWFYKQKEGTEICAYSDGGWFLANNPTWRLKNYVINDKYLMFRKTLADGGKVERWVTGVTWEGVDKSDVFDAPLSSYRKKATKPKLKYGDWVYVPTVNNTSELVKLNEEFHDIDTNSVMFKERYCRIFNSKLKLWEHKVGEYVWAISAFGGIILCKITRINNDGSSNTIDTEGDYQEFSNFEPFIGTLPTNIKG